MTSIAPPICSGCKHLIGDLRDPRCTAFRGGIPRPILLSEADHRQPFENDNGVRFDPVSPADADYAERLFRKP